jgi:mono/diheme cytochrome c family protein
MNKSRSRWQVAALAGLLVAVAGCMKTEAPRFRLNKEGPDLRQASSEQEQMIVDAMYAMFGTPDQPYDVNLFAESGLDIKKLRMAAGSAARSGPGESQRHGLYREHCAHCHGISGDGAGPTAAFLDPFPRDYRRGLFKFTSTASGKRPTSEDLKRTVVEGIPGTAMPSFALLPEDEVDALIEYVKYLAIRGETESFVYSLLVNDEEELTRELLIDGALTPVLENWSEEELAVFEPRPPVTIVADADNDNALSREEAEARFAENFAQFDADKDEVLDEKEQMATDANADGKVDEIEEVANQAWPDPFLQAAADADGDKRITRQEGEDRLLAWFERADADGDGRIDGPERLAASVAAGRVLFQDAQRAKCGDCHGPTGMGDGGQVIYDNWNDPKKEFKTESGLIDPNEIAEYWTLPIQRLRPRNLRQGTYRGGRRPLDIYRRIHVGIKGTPMPNLGPSETNRGALSPDEIWALVDFVRSLPYEESSQPYPKQAAVTRDVN